MKISTIFQILLASIGLLVLISVLSSIRNTYSLKVHLFQKKDIVASVPYDTNAAKLELIPYFIECVARCIYIGHPKKGCYHSDGIALRATDRWRDDWKQVNAVYNVTTTIDDGSILVVLDIHTAARNINHIFHDDFWSILSYFSRPYTLQNHDTNQSVVNMTLMYDYSSPWLTSLLEIIVQCYPWWKVIPLNYATLTCSTTGKVYATGFVRDLHLYQVNELGRIRGDLRNIAYQVLDHRNLWWTETNHEIATRTIQNKNTGNNDRKLRKERIVIYTREDVTTRQIHHTEYIVDVLDAEKYEIYIQRTMPTDFYEQIAMFASADLLIAPNGGWTPNVMWMSNTACIVEIHLYVMQSWLQRYGLSSLFAPPDHVMLLKGDYHNESLGPRLQLPNRYGGDDEIQGSMVVHDIVNALQHSPDCSRFLKK